MSGGPWEDYANSPQASASASGGPWDDYAVPQAAPQQSSGFHWPSLSSVFNGVVSGASESANSVRDTFANASLVGIGKQVASAARGGVELTQDALAGRLDPTSEDAIGKAAKVATIASPVTPASRLALAAPAAVAAAPVRDAADLGVTLTAGQRSGDPALLSTENAMFGGGKGEAAQRVAQDAVARQRGEIDEVRAAIGDTAGRGQADLSRSADAGELVGQGVKEAAAQGKAAYQERYADAFAQPGEIDPRFFTGAAKPGANEMAVPGSAMAGIAAPLSQRITERLVNRAEPVIVDQTLTPAAHRALGELDAVSNLRLGSIGQPGAEDVVAGINLRGVDQARRKLAAYSRAASTNPSDKRAVGAIIGEFDSQLQSAMENGLFSGSDEALAKLIDARQAFASYQKTFKPQGAGDDVGQALRAITERDATPEQIANYLYGASKVGAQGRSVRLADRLKTIVGEDSPEWAAIRQGAWQRVTGPADLSVKRSADRIADFLDGEGKSLSTRLFSEPERIEMRKFANVLKAVSSRPGTINPSNSGNRLAALARESFSAIASMLGAQTGGVPGAALGYVAGRGAAALSNARAAGQARQLFSGQAPVSIGQRVRQGGEATQTFLGPRAAIYGAHDVLPTLGLPRLQGPVPVRAQDENR